MAFTLYLVNFVGQYFVGPGGNPLLQIVFDAAFANVRATILSRRWSAQPTDETDFQIEDRSASGLWDRFSNQFPGKIWPVGDTFSFL
jgi:hypothetical protein